jgi:hypothetical protein
MLRHAFGSWQWPGRVLARPPWRTSARLAPEPPSADAHLATLDVYAAPHSGHLAAHWNTWRPGTAVGSLLAGGFCHGGLSHSGQRAHFHVLESSTLFYDQLLLPYMLRIAPSCSTTVGRLLRSCLTQLLLGNFSNKDHISYHSNKKLCSPTVYHKKAAASPCYDLEHY